MYSSQMMTLPMTLSNINHPSALFLCFGSTFIFGTTEARVFSFCTQAISSISLMMADYLQMGMVRVT